MRKYLIDTSSILSLFRYYAHFDTNGELESYQSIRPLAHFTNPNST